MIADPQSLEVMIPPGFGDWIILDEVQRIPSLLNFVQTYLREEVLQEGLTRNVGDFARFLEVASFS